MRFARVLLGVLALLVPSGLAAAQASTPPVSISYDANATFASAPPRLMRTIPPSLGLYAPSVFGYRCGGFFIPAQPVPITPSTPPSEIVGLPFWQLTLTCLDPSLPPRLPRGRMRAGVVWLFENPVPQGMALSRAMRQLGGGIGGRIAADGPWRIGEGRVLFGGSAKNAVWLVRGATSYLSQGKRRTEAVGIMLTGRGVPLWRLRQFARDLYRLAGQD